MTLGVVVADAAAFWLGLAYGFIGIGVAVSFIFWTQSKADAYWRAHNAATAPSVDEIDGLSTSIGNAACCMVAQTVNRTRSLLTDIMTP